MTAAGVVEEGIIRSHINKSGQWRDSVVHAMYDGAPLPAPELPSVPLKPRGRVR